MSSLYSGTVLNKKSDYRNLTRFLIYNIEQLNFYVL